MNFCQTIERLQLLHTLTQQKNTGTPEQLAKRLGVSRSCLYNLIEELKSFELPVIYSRKIESFCYEQEIEFELNLKIKIISKEDLLNINGGNFISVLPSTFLDGRNIPLYSYFANTKSQLTGL